MLYAPLVEDLHKPVWQSEFVEASCGLVDAHEGSGQLETPFPEVAHLQPEELVRLATRGPLASMAAGQPKHLRGKSVGPGVEPGSPPEGAYDSRSVRHRRHTAGVARPGHD